MPGCASRCGLKWIILVLYIFVTAVRADTTTSLPATHNRPLVVTTIIEPPYVDECNPPVSGDCIPAAVNGNTTHIKGFMVDLLKKLAEKGNFRYEIRTAKDMKYGTKNQAGEWTGMIGELLRKEADLGLAPFTVTQERAQVADFTASFLDYGLSILLKRPALIPMGPLGYKLSVPIADQHDLSAQMDIKYGILAGGMTSRVFQNSKVNTYKRMWETMSANPEQTFFNNTADAIERVRNSDGKFAFIMEKETAYYIAGRHCDIMTIDFDQDVKYNATGYSLGLPPGSKWTKTLSRLIEELKADGSVATMHDQWWKSTCPEPLYRRSEKMPAF